MSLSYYSEVTQRLCAAAVSWRPIWWPKESIWS